MAFFSILFFFSYDIFKLLFSCRTEKDIKLTAHWLTSFDIWQRKKKKYDGMVYISRIDGQNVEDMQRTNDMISLSPENLFI